MQYGMSNLPPFPDDHEQQALWIDALFNRIVEVCRARREEEVDPIVQRHAEMQEALSKQAAAIKELADSQTHLVSQLEAVLACSRLIRMLERGSKAMARSWLVRVTVVTFASVHAFFQGSWKAFWASLISLFK